jgi:replication factor C subunit 1
MNNNHHLWINKYKPKKISDVVGNSNEVYKIIYWLKKWYKKNNEGNKLNNHNSIIVSGSRGIGKTSSIKLILNELNFKPLFLYSNNLKNKKVIEKIVKSNTKHKNVYNSMTKNKIKRFVLVIDDAETITLSSEKASLIELFKKNKKEKIFPIIFLTSFHYSKLITEIKKQGCLEIKYNQLTNLDLKKLITKIYKKENIIINDNDIINKIIKFSQKDIRRLINTLQDINYSFPNQKITKTILKQYFYNSQKKDRDVSLFDATRKLLDSYHDVNTCIVLYEMEKVLLPLMIHENFYKTIFLKHNNNRKILNIMKYVTNAISEGDVVETNIYTDQNWYLQNIHGFYTCAETSHHINKYNNNKKNNQFYQLSFSSDLNKTSLKNINRKNITGLQYILPHKSISDIIYVNKLIYNLIANNKLDVVYDKVHKYNFTIKNIEVSIKVDKTIQSKKKLVLTSKNKKLLTQYFKNNF